MQDDSSKPLPPLRSQLILLAIACAGPLLLALALILVYFQQHDQGRSELEAQRVARAAAAVVDRQLLAAQVVALALAGNPPPAGTRGSALPAEHHLVLTENGTPSLLAGSPMPLDRAGNAARLKQSGAARPALSLLPANGKEAARLAFDVPLARAGKPNAVLSLLLPPALLDKALEELRLPAGSVIAVLAPDGRLLARSGDDGRASGQPAGEALRGLATQASYLRSTDSPWSITVAAPAAEGAGLLGGPFPALAAVLAALVLGGLGAAALAARRIADSMDALRRPAQALADGTPLDMPRLAFQEAQQLGDTLLQLERNMTRHRQDLERLVEERTAQLENSNALLETIYATAPVGLSFVDTRLRILMINDYLAAFNGMPVNEHIGRRFDEVIHDRNIVANLSLIHI